MDDRDPAPDTAVQAEPPTIGEKPAHGAPWWLVSIFAHGVVAIVCVFIVAVASRIGTEIPVVIKPPTPPEQPPVIPDNRIDPIPVELEREAVDPMHARPTDDPRNEDPTEDPFETTRGEAKDAFSDMPFKYKSVNSSIGLSGNAGGDKGGAGGLRYRRAAGGGGGKDTEDAVMAALLWLARHQNPDGSWSAQKHTDRCNQGAFKGVCAPATGAANFDVGLTGLSLLAFLGAGYSHLSKDVVQGYHFGNVVRNGLQFLMRVQEASGRVGPDDAPKYMYNHLIGAFALSEAFSLTSSPLIKDSAQRAVDYAVQAQNPGKAWRYSFQSGDNDSSVTGWGLQLLKSAELAELTVPREAYQGILAWYDFATENAYHYTGYLSRDRGKVVIAGVNDHFADHPALSAIAGMARMCIKGKADPHVRGAAELCIADLPEWDARALKVDFYYWYYASYMMFLLDGPTGSFWKRWHDRIKPAILEKQNKAKGDCRHGSWEPVDRWSCEGGRVYTTATGALILEVYYRSVHAVNWFYKQR